MACPVDVATCAVIVLVTVSVIVLVIVLMIVLVIVLVMTLLVGGNVTEIMKLSPNTRKKIVNMIFLRYVLIRCMRN